MSQYLDELKNNDVYALALYFPTTTTSEMELFCDALKLNVSLKVIRLEARTSNELTLEFCTKIIKYITDALEINTRVNIVSIKCIGLNDTTIKYFTNMLKINTNIYRIILNNNKITSNGAKYIANMLKENTSLITINLLANEIGSTGIKYITDALKVNNSLTELEINYIKMGIDGANYISYALKVNDTLQHLYMYHNDIDSKQFKFIFGDTLKYNKSLVSCGMFNTIEYIMIFERNKHNNLLRNVTLQSLCYATKLTCN